MPYLATMHTFSRSYTQADFFGKLIFLGLFVVSMICWIILLYKLWMLRNVEKQSSHFFKNLDLKSSTLLNTTLDASQKKGIKETPEPFKEIFSTLKTKTLEILNKNHYFLNPTNSGGPETVYLSRSDIDLIESHLQTTIQSQKASLEKHIYVLSLISHLAPFLGLLGTVWGILITFSGLQVSGGISSNSTLLSGLSTALATTVIGLLIAIPALIGSKYLKHAISRFSMQMYDFSHTLVSTVELQYRKVDLS